MLFHYAWPVCDLSLATRPAGNLTTGLVCLLSRSSYSQPKVLMLLVLLQKFFGFFSIYGFPERRKCHISGTDSCAQWIHLMDKSCHYIFFFFITLKKNCLILAGPFLDKSLKRSVKHKWHHYTTINTCGHCKTHQLRRREETASARPLAPAPLLTIEKRTERPFGCGRCCASPKSSRTPMAAPISHMCLPFLDEPHVRTRHVGVITGSDGSGMRAGEQEG